MTENTNQTNITKRTLKIDDPLAKKSKILTEIEAPKEEPQIIDPVNEPNCYLVVRNLVRPFTIKQLINHMNTVVDDCKMEEDQFWIDDIKSFCYVKYKTVEDSSKVLKATNGTKWPSMNPKILHVDYANLHTMYIETNGKLGQIDPNQNEVHSVNTHIKDSCSLVTNCNNLSTNKNKLQNNNMTSVNNIDNEAILNEAIDVDTLFRKTQAFPPIYWLPCKEKDGCANLTTSIEKSKDNFTYKSVQNEAKDSK